MSIRTTTSSRYFYEASKFILGYRYTCMLIIVSQISSRYMTEILPLTNWKQEAVRPGLNLILRRLDRLFNKISKKSSLRVQLSFVHHLTDWYNKGFLDMSNKKLWNWFALVFQNFFFTLETGRLERCSKPFTRYEKHIK